MSLWFTGQATNGALAQVHLTAPWVPTSTSCLFPQALNAP